MKPEKIGEKIKRIRKETNPEIQQANLYSNQSAVSQVENGRIMPTPSLLRNFVRGFAAHGVDISFEELIENTTWKPVAESRTDAEYAISQTQVDVKIEDWGEIKTTRKYYDAYDKHGVARKYDPETGFRMMTNCKGCNSPISKPDQQFCFSCGKNIFGSFGNWFKETFEYDWEGNELSRSVKFEGDISESELYEMQGYKSEIVTKVDTELINSIEKINGRLESMRYVLPRLQEIKIHFENPINTPAFISELTSTYTIDGLQRYHYLYNMIFYKDTEDGRMIRYGSEWRNIDDKDEKLQDYLKGKKVLHPDYFDDFNPNNEKFDWFLPYWKDKVTELSYNEGLVKELLRHQRRLESQQSIGEELEKEKSDKSKDEKKS